MRRVALLVLVLVLVAVAVAGRHHVDWVMAASREKIAAFRHAQGERTVVVIDGKQNTMSVHDALALLAKPEPEPEPVRPARVCLPEGARPRLADYSLEFVAGVLLDHVLQHPSEPLPWYWGDWVDFGLEFRGLLQRPNKLSCNDMATDNGYTDAVRKQKRARTFNTQPRRPQRPRHKTIGEFCLSDGEYMGYLKGEGPPGLFALLNIFGKGSQGTVPDSFASPGFHITSPPNTVELPVLARMYGVLYLHSIAPPPVLLVVMGKPGTLDRSVEVAVAGGKMRQSVVAPGGLAADHTCVDWEEKFSAVLANAQPHASRPLEVVLGPHDFQVDMKELRKLWASELQQAEPGTLAHTKLLRALGSYDRALAAWPNEAKYFISPKVKPPERVGASRTPNYDIGHYDWRFYNTPMGGDVLLTGPQRNYHRQDAIRRLVRLWLRFSSAHSIPSWIAHGLLLGWYWDGHLLPWDLDVDVVMPVKALYQLARDFNQTAVLDQAPLGLYLIDVGASIFSRERGNRQNLIDARYIDTVTGMYIDITALAESKTGVPLRLRNVRPVYACRNKHFARLEEVLPLQLTAMEGVPAYVPRRFGVLLAQEYKTGMVKTKFLKHEYVAGVRMWVSRNVLERYHKTIGDREFGDGDTVPLLQLDSELLARWRRLWKGAETHQREIEPWCRQENVEKEFKGGLRVEDVDGEVVGGERELGVVVP